MNRFLDCQVSWIFYLLTYRKLPTFATHWALQESKDNWDPVFFYSYYGKEQLHSPWPWYTCNAHTLQWTKKKTLRIHDSSNTHGFPCSDYSGVFVFIICTRALLWCWSFVTSLSCWNIISKLGYWFEIFQ